MSTYEEMLYFLTPAELLSWRILLNVAFLHPMDKQRKLNIAFVHPDLGIVVDAARALLDCGHRVTIFTNHYDPARCFDETKNMNIVVTGSWIPRTFYGGFIWICSVLRSMWMALWILIKGSRYDVVFVDKVGYSIPILKWCARKSLFYCHFPDSLPVPRSKNRAIKLYQSIVYWLERETIFAADMVLANSNFTADAFVSYYGDRKGRPMILNPSVDEVQLRESSNVKPSFPWPKDRRLLTSINRFDRHKNLGLAIETMGWLQSKRIGNNLILVLAGGCDLQVQENIDHLAELQALCRKHNLPYVTIWPNQEPVAKDDEIRAAKVLFMPSISDSTRNFLLSKSSCLLYTPINEHFGIVPLEAMALGIPVIAMNSGGPLETIINGQTGFLCEPSAASVGSHIERLLNDSLLQKTISKQAVAHVRQSFSINSFKNNLETILFHLASK